MGVISIDLNTSVFGRQGTAAETNNGGLIGQIITEKMFGVNFLSSFENGPASVTGGNYDEVIFALGNRDQFSAGQGEQTISPHIQTLRFPGGTLTEQLFAMADSSFTLTTPINFRNQTGISAAEFMQFCKEVDSDMTQVMPTWRYLRDGGMTAIDRAEIFNYVKSLLHEGYRLGVNINAFEIGNEYWCKLNVNGLGDTTMTADQYGKIAATQAEIIQAAIDDFKRDINETGPIRGSWVEPDILVQIGSPNSDVSNIGRLKAQYDTQTILDSFTTVQQRAAVDGFVTHRYVGTIDHIADPYVGIKILHFQEIRDMLDARGWQEFDQMTFAVSEWNLDQNSAETGLKSYAAIVALMGEMLALGVNAADFWSVAARSMFPLARFDDRYSPSADFQGLTFAGEAFRMMNESLVGKQQISLYKKANGSINTFDGNKLDVANGDNFRTYVEAFSDRKEVVLFISNLSGVRDILNLDISGMIGDRAAFAWASSVESSSSNPLDANATPIVSNFNVALQNGVLKNYELGANETLRLTVSLGSNGAKVLGYNGHEKLHGGSNADIIEGRAGNDTVLGWSGNDTLWGGLGADALGGGKGNDQLNGGDGSDQLTIDLGRNILNGGDGSDTAIYKGSLNIRVDLANKNSQNTGVGTDRLASIENVTSGGGNDVLHGNHQANRLSGGAGNDRLFGRSGDDILYGNRGNDFLDGGAGQDTLRGGAGADRLTGGAGADMFVFDRGFGRDQIADFQDGLDQIRFTQAGAKFSDLRISATTGGVSVELGTDTIVLTGANVAQIGAADFIFS